MQQAEKVCLAIAVFIAYYEATCDDGQLISEAFDRFLEKYLVLGRLLIGLTALHLANALDGRWRWVDPYKWIGRIVTC